VERARLPIRRRWSALPLALLLTVALTATPAGAVGDPWAGVPEPGAAWTPAELKRIDDLLRLELAELRDRMRSRQRESTAFVPAAARATNAHGILIAQLRLDARRRLAALGAGRPDPGPDPRLEGLWELLRDWSDLLALVDVLRDQDPLDEGRASRIEKLDDDLEFRIEEVQARIGLAPWSHRSRLGDVIPGSSKPMRRRSGSKPAARSMRSPRPASPSCGISSSPSAC
jgi:hypothetical protein